jgi:hypothetical protein
MYWLYAKRGTLLSIFKELNMKFRFSSGVTLAYSKYEPGLNLREFCECSFCVNSHVVFLSGVTL